MPAASPQGAPCEARIVRRIDAVDSGDWNRLAGRRFPFLRHEFLEAMEASGSVGHGTGWEPAHLLLERRGRPCAAMPLYKKTNSWGEFVFDFAWSDAYRRAGLRYYPKLVSAVPFTPATSPRCLTGDEPDRDALCALLGEAALNAVERLSASSLHVLFPTDADRDALKRAGLSLRKDCQFHWHNRGYGDFDAFLGEMTSKKRKNVRRERRRVAETGIRFRRRFGGELTAADWQRIMPLYGSSFWRRGREPYLNQDFFERIGRALPEQLLVIEAELHHEPIAVAICFVGEDTLFGRYWGADDRYHSLHFETCYYQGIEFCIERGLTRFEPGTQGEHKISRGFVPTETWSAHWLSHPQFAAAVDEYLERERDYIDGYIDAAGAHAPYRRGD